VISYLKTSLITNSNVLEAYQENYYNQNHDKTYQLFTSCHVD
jgi:hypothetical protein